jgi:hypothetical protein
MLNRMIKKDLSLRENGRLSRYLVISRQEWAQLRDTTPLTLSEESVQALRSLNDPISLQEVEHDRPPAPGAALQLAFFP